MASVAVSNGAANPASPVPLDTIPVSPADGANGGAEHDDGEVEAKAPVTVFHDPDNFDVIHPLANTWTLWFTKPSTGRGDNWNDLLKEVITFESVEMFWGIWHNIAKVSELPVKADYHLFKKGVRPEWEDIQNKHGGRWAYTTKEKKGVPIDELWLQVMLSTIGETLEDEDDNEIMGVVVNIRKGFYRIGLWTRTTGKALPGGANGAARGDKPRTVEEGTQVLKRIGENFKAAMKLDKSEPVEFTGHSDSAHSGSSRAKAKLVV